LYEKQRKHCPSERKILKKVRTHNSFIEEEIGENAHFDIFG
jgi:hypothetical protein